jgi:hypothetical protein
MLCLCVSQVRTETGKVSAVATEAWEGHACPYLHTRQSVLWLPPVPQSGNVRTMPAT